MSHHGEVGRRRITGATVRAFCAMSAAIRNHWGEAQQAIQAFGRSRAVGLRTCQNVRRRGVFCWYLGKVSTSRPLREKKPPLPLDSVHMVSASILSRQRSPTAELLPISKLTFVPDDACRRPQQLTIFDGFSRQVSQTRSRLYCN